MQKNSHIFMKMIVHLTNMVQINQCAAADWLLQGNSVKQKGNNNEEERRHRDHQQ